MAQAFTATEAGAMTKTPEGTKRHVLVTGAAGRIGSYFAEHSHEKYDLRLMVRGDEKRIEKIRPWGEMVDANLSDLDRLKEICKGIDTVVHLAGDPGPSSLWQSLLETNIIGTYNLFAAAKSAGVRRVVYASSIHAVSGYPADVQVKTSEPVNPGDIYGVSKCFAEALCRYMAEKEGVSAIAIRIGAFQPLEAAQSERSLGMLDAFVSERDLNQLIGRCIDVENVQFAILHGLSDNRFKRLDITDARELVGYAPEDDSTNLHPTLRELKLRERVLTNGGKIDQNKSGMRAETE